MRRQRTACVRLSTPSHFIWLTSPAPCISTPQLAAKLEQTQGERHQEASARATELEVCVGEVRMMQSLGMHYSSIS